MSIMTTLSLFAFKTCLKFLPVLAPPRGNQHVLVIANPQGVRKCVPSTSGHSIDEPHTVILGYDCLRPPHIEMMLMKALGFPFEHNRASRDVFIEVQFENIEPHAMQLFTKDVKLPLELRALSYDVDSVLHFGERDYSKNGHRTIIFKDRSNAPVRQNRVGLSPIDLRKIEIVYGPECRKRDRQEKIELCQNYPGVARKKREVTEGNLRVNRDITPPPEGASEQINNSLKDLGIEDEVQDVVDQVYKVSSKALRNARAKYCNVTKPDLRVSEEKFNRNNSNPDILGIIETIADYARNMVDNAVANLTEFCRTSEDLNMYQRARARCPFYGARDCPVSYKSTKSGPVRYSTQHRPVYFQSTKNDGRPYRPQFARTGNETGNSTEGVGSRKKRHAEIPTKADDAEARRRDEEVTTVENQRRSDNDTNIPVTVPANNNNTKAGLRIATDIPEKKRIEYETEWPGNHRRFKAKKKVRSEKEWDDSNVSLEKREERETNIKQRERQIKQRERIIGRGKKTRHVQNRQKSRLLREQPEHPPEAHNTDGMTVHLSKANQEFYNERKWPDGVVRYILVEDPNYDLDDVRRRLAEVNSILEKKTCVKLEEITEDEAKEHEDYLVVDTSADFVTGRVGGRQNFGSLELYRGGQHRQHTAMVAMAMLGFYFELSRHDRDRYVRVHLRHVRPDKLHHFEKIRSDATFPLPYDYESATHPAWQFWRKVGKKGISTVATFKSKDPEGEIMKSLGQNEKLFSEMDIVKINSVYGVKCFQKNALRTGKNKKRRPAKRRE
ncbi:uncharacterized protein LOC114353216 [Ostrinia furnacalis]|uniref:uncharacterized protein LOC114353216 n=1 Tax=Ostrinia furnacalis TaxID=93504 RepID=UPI00103A1B48|nr:uncharacterized protein LOC114353216 [Ostrinia furnacalis]